MSKECADCKYLQESKEVEELRNDILCLTRELRQVNENKSFISDLSKKENSLIRENRELKKDVLVLTRENREMRSIIEELNDLCEERLAEVRELKKIVERFESGEVMLIEC